MSRSEHATRRDPRDPEDLARKRRVKLLAAEERIAPIELPDVEAEAVRIVVRDRGPYVHFPASADDLRSIVARIRVVIELGDPIARELRLRKVETLECVAHVRAGRYAAAFELASRLVEQGARSTDLVAARFEAAYHLHMPYNVDRLPRAFAHLRRIGYGAWVDRLEALLR